MTVKKGIWRYIKIILKYSGILLIIFILYFIYDITLSTPPFNDQYSIEQYQRIQVAPSHYKVGNCWLKKNDKGIWEMYLEGEPYERGLIYGVLARELMEKQELHFVNQINEIVPNRITLFFLKMFVAWFNSDLDEYIPIENQTEIYGISQSFSNRYNYIGPKYYRILNYHAAHDIGHALKGLSLVGCTSFSVNNNLSKDSSLLIARNFDFYMGDDFADDKLILFVKPSKGYSFSSYSWAGFTGVVSGMNEKGLTITLNASKSEIPYGAKDPISLLAREILQYAKNIEEAIQIAKKRDVFVSESLLIGSAEDNKSIIIEKSPEKMDVFDSNTDLVTCANHYQGKEFVNDSINIQNIKNSDSKYRFDRVNELLNSKYPVSRTEAVDILRNKNGLNNEFIGYGNPKAINQLIAHHAVILKPSKRQMWVSTPPYQLGDFIGYDLNKIFDTIPLTNFTYIDSLTIPSDKFVTTVEYKNYEDFKNVKQGIQESIMQGTPYLLSKKNEEKFIATNPDNYITYLVLGDYYLSKTQYKNALKFYETSLTHSVASIDEEMLIKSKIQTCENKLK